MAKVNHDWRVLRHGPIDRLEPNLWSVTGTLPGMSSKDKPAFRAHLERPAAKPDLRRIVVAHHQPITEDPAATLLRVAAAL